MDWKLSDWQNVDWCKVIIMPTHQGGGSPERRVNIFYKVAKWDNGTFYSGLLSDKFPEIVKKYSDKYGQPAFETKLYTLIVHKDRL